MTSDIAFNTALPFSVSPMTVRLSPPSTTSEAPTIEVLPNHSDVYASLLSRLLSAFSLKYEVLTV